MRTTGKPWRRILLYLLLLAAAIALPLVFRRTFIRNMLILIGIWSIAGIGWNYIGGYAGQESIGHAMFFAIGMYTPAALFDLYKVMPLVSIPLGMLIAAVVAVLAGIPLLRLKGPQFSIATMAMTECARYIFINWEALGGCATVFGPIVGATVLTYISQNTRVWFGGAGTGIDLILYGALVILVVLFLPNGVLSIPGMLKKRFAKKEAPAT